MRLSAESEGKRVFGVDTSQEEFDQEKLRDSVVQELSQGKPVAFSFEDVSASPESVIGPFYAMLRDYLENRGFDPGMMVKNYTDNNGVVIKSILLITPRR